MAKPNKLRDISFTDRERDRPIYDFILIREAPRGNEPDPTHPLLSDVVHRDERNQEDNLENANSDMVPVKLPT